MKLLRWAVAGASVYAVYRYSIGKKAKGEDVFAASERNLIDFERQGIVPDRAMPMPAKAKRRSKTPA